MNLVVRPANLESDRELLIETHFRYLTSLSDDFRYDWLYRRNPHGEARAWVAIDREHDTVVGAVSAFPRRIYLNGREELGWVLGDFCINDRYRSLGPAVQLQQACLAEVHSGTLAFFYDFPSTSMIAVYKRLRINPFGQMLRLTKPLRVDRKIRKFIKIPMLARGMSAVGNLLLALSDRTPSDHGTLTISLHEGECGEEFSALSEEFARGYGVCIKRSAKYLNWRYLTNPLRRYELLTARCDGTLLAYAVFTHDGEDAMVVDLFGIEEPGIISALVDRLVALLRKRGMITVNTPLLEAHRWVPLLQYLGFRIRESSPVVVYTTSRFPANRSILDNTGWFLLHGDRDS
jgi:hypothetical protein